MRRWLMVVLLGVLLVAGCETVTPGPSPLATPVSGGDLTPAARTAGEAPQVELSGAGIAAIVGVLTSVLLAYVPGFQAWWEAFAYKRETLAGVGFVVAVALVGLHYLGALDLGLGPFGWPVVWRVIETWLTFSGAGQLAFTGQRLTRGEDA